jgi:UDP-N-acetylmuramoyl-tripeptide--D-alanyl-D-alanine ligase
MTAALNNFAQLAVPHKVVMLGDMLELGDQSLSLHQEIYQKASACHPEQIFLCGQQFSRAFESLKEKRIEIDTPTFDFGNIEQLCNHLQHLPLEHCHILIKGSHGAQMEKAVEYL